MHKERKKPKSQDMIKLIYFLSKQGEKKKK